MYKPQMIDVAEVATLLKCSTRQVRRLSDSGRMPKPVHLGRLVRWLQSDVDAWLVAGCPACRSTKKTGVK